MSTGRDTSSKSPLLQVKLASLLQKMCTNSKFQNIIPGIRVRHLNPVLHRKEGLRHHSFKSTNQ